VLRGTADFLFFTCMFIRWIGSPGGADGSMCRGRFLTVGEPNRPIAMRLRECQQRS